MWLRLLSPMIVLACPAATLLAAPIPAPRPVPPKEEGVLAKGRTVILGTWSWKVEGNRMGSAGQADVFWQQVSSTERNLVPQGEAGWAILKEVPFEKIGRQDLRKATYSRGKLSGASLRPGTVLALRTQDGKFAKVKVVGYRSLHDTSFPEAKYLPPGWVRFAQAKPNVKEYHLEVDWVLFKNGK